MPHKSMKVQVSITILCTSSPQQLHSANMLEAVALTIFGWSLPRKPAFKKSMGAPRFLLFRPVGTEKIPFTYELSFLSRFATRSKNFFFLRLQSLQNLLQMTVHASAVNAKPFGNFSIRDTIDHRKVKHQRTVFRNRICKAIDF